MKKLKKWIIVCAVILVGIVFLAVACSGSGDSSSDGSVPSGSTGSGAATQNSAKANITETVLVDRDGIKVVATKLDYSGLLGPEVKVSIENNSEKNVTVSSRNLSVNGVMIFSGLHGSVAAGKKGNDSLYLSRSDLDIAGIKTIKEIEFNLHVYDSDSFDGIFDSDVIVLKTDADESYVQTYDDSGAVIYDRDDVKVVVKKIDSAGSLLGTDICLYIENNGTKNLMIHADNVSLNGYMMDPLFSVSIAGGKKAYDTLSFLESDLTENGIEKIGELELTLRIRNEADFLEVTESDPITVTFE